MGTKLERIAEISATTPKPEEKLYMGRVCRYAESLSFSKTKDLCEVIDKSKPKHYNKHTKSM